MAISVKEQIVDQIDEMVDGLSITSMEGLSKMKINELEHLHADIKRHVEREAEHGRT